MSITAPERKKLERALENLYERYGWKRYVDPDPLVFLYDYPDVRDREIVGLIAASLAFGGVRQIMGSVEKVISPMGVSPREFVTNTSPKRMAKIFDRFRHRWATSDDLVQMLTAVVIGSFFRIPWERPVEIEIENGEGIKLKIEGMTCGHCVTSVTKALKESRGVESALVDLKKREAVVTGGDIDVALLREAVESLGYKVIGTDDSGT